MGQSLGLFPPPQNWLCLMQSISTFSGSVAAAGPLQQTHTSLIMRSCAGLTFPQYRCYAPKRGWPAFLAFAVTLTLLG
eukprot:5114314-Prorocentrum_lima.AAC.1